MGRLDTLKRHAQNRLAKLELELPVYKWEPSDDPVKLNAIFRPREWELDSPVKALTEGKEDWLHWFVCDPSAGSSLEIFFGRFQEGIAVAWARLKIDGRLLVLKERFYNDSSDGHVYSAGGLRLECNAPMRAWRLALNVIMDEPATGSTVHVRVGAQVAMVGHTLELPKQVRPSFLARRFASIEDLDEAKREISRSCNTCQAIVQPVSAFAEIVLDGEKQETMLFGSRLKFFGNSNMLRDSRLIIGYAENGTTFVTIAAKDKAYGYLSNPTHYVQPIRKTRWVSQDEQATGTSNLQLHLETAGCKYVLNLGNASDAKEYDAVAEGTLLVGKKAIRLLRTCFECPATIQVPQTKLELCQLLRFPREQNDSLLLSTSDAACKDPKLTGGKGSSLAVLTSISNHLKSFTVPSAVVLTVNAYAKFAGTQQVSRAIEKFLESTRNADMAALKTASDACVAAISEATLPESIEKSLTDKLEEQFGPLWYLKKFAVRSSAVGEDSEEMSAAGQMTTYLGVRGERAISSAVVKCWASQFALTAVNYKRQYGQDLNSSMAVVVQEMVSAESAGVMFTCDPLTSSPLGIFITANFGLGESVVSATADPDTYSLKRVGTDVILETKARGAKDSMVVESEDGSGTKEMEIQADKRQTFCLTDERAIKIASIGVKLTDINDSPRDIEWAVVHGKIYLLQSRPVTSFLRESDFEIRHDFNSGFYTNREILSRANLDEVMPGVFSPLAISFIGHLLFETFSKKKVEWGRSDPSQFTYLQNVSCGKKSFMNFSQNGLADNKTVVKTTGVTMFGYDISNHEAMKNGIIHTGTEASSLNIIPLMLNALRNIKPLVKDLQKQAETFQLDIPEDTDTLSLFFSVIRKIPKLDPFMDGLMAATMPSGVYNVMTLNTLKSSQGAEDFAPDLMILLSKLLRSDLEVESAHIPNELMALSAMLREDSSGKKFVDMTADEALTWLESDENEAAKQFRVLRSKHAHRCYKEFDIHSKTWDIDPIPLVQTLQSMARCPENEAAKKNESPMTVDQLPKRPSLFQRMLLNFLIPRAQYAVYAREATKSTLVKSIHSIRLAMRKVGLKLHAEGRLPDPELIFFLNCDEIYRLITTRDPTLLPKAIRRKRLHPILDQERFPVLLYGMPKPIDSGETIIDPNAQSMEGVPVSEGLVTGPARVILSFLTEAHLIKKGDILVTRATDTGWTPYFPLLGGVVTEVGGLLSHGAVVAREYGLPAIVGVSGATEFVKSGDIVTLDGNKGILHKSPVSQSSEEQVDSRNGGPALRAEGEQGTESTRAAGAEDPETTSDIQTSPEGRGRAKTTTEEGAPLIACEA